MLIAHITDPHLGLDTAWMPGHPGPAEALRRALAHVAAFRPAPDVLLLTGDLSNTGAAADYVQVRQLIEGAWPRFPEGAPKVWAIPGNHDLPAVARRELAALMPVAPDAPPARICLHTTHGGLHFIGLDTVQLGHPHGALEPVQLTWLARTLQRCAGQPVLIHLHHPPITSGISAMDAIGLLQGRAELARLVAEHGGVQLIAAGHIHRPILGTLGGAPVVVAPSTSHQLELDLRHGAPLACRDEPPMIGLYRWSPEGGMVCHFSHVTPFPGPFPV